MKIDEFIVSMAVLGVAYNKSFTQDEIKIWYDYFKTTKFEILKQAIKNIIPKKKFLPSIAELLEECSIVSENNIERVLREMEASGYFRSAQEVDKVYFWLKKGIVPDWLKEDIKKFNNSKKQIENEKVLLEGKWLKKREKGNW